MGGTVLAIEKRRPCGDPATGRQVAKTVPPRSSTQFTRGLMVAEPGSERPAAEQEADDRHRDVQREFT